MNEAATDSSIASAPPDQAWSRHKLVFLITLAAACQVALIFDFGKRQFASQPRLKHALPVQLRLADPASELVALDDPTLFALPHANDFATAYWQRPPTLKLREFRWTEPSGLLPLPTATLGAHFSQFMQTNPTIGLQLDFKPSPALAEPIVPPGSIPPAASTLQIAGPLAGSALLNPVNLPPIPFNDVLPPSKVQVIAGIDGVIVSAILLESSGDDEADRQALAMGNRLRFGPADRLRFGELIFNWHTVPPAATRAHE
jgi:hypothetical protein